MINQEYTSVLHDILGGMHLKCVGVRILEYLEVISSIIDFVGYFMIQLRQQLNRELRSEQLNSVECIEVLYLLRKAFKFLRVGFGLHSTIKYEL